MSEALKFIWQRSDSSLHEADFADITQTLKNPNATIGDMIDAHIDFFGFDKPTSDQEHEVAHLVLGMAFLNMGYSPIKLQSPHNGNIFSEPLAEALQRPISIYINDGSVYSPPNAAQLREELDVFAPGRVSVDFNALISCQELVEHQGLDKTALEIFREHNYSSTELFGNPDIHNFSEPAPAWEDVISNDELEKITKFTTPAINQIMSTLQKAGESLPEKASLAERKEFFQNALRGMAAHDVWDAMKSSELIAKAEDNMEVVA